MFACTLTTLGCGGGGGGGHHGDDAPVCNAEAPANVAGDWSFSAASISSDTCPSGLASSTCDAAPEEWTVTQNGAAVLVDDQKGDALNGCVANNGAVNASVNENGTSDNCTVSLDITFAGNLSASPADAAFAFGVSGHCPGGGSLNCRFTCAGTFTRNNTAAAAREAGGETFADIVARALGD